MTADPVRWLWTGIAFGLWLLIVAAVAWSRAQTRRASASRVGALTAGAKAITVAFASQTGLAEELAWMTARSLSDAGTSVRVVPIGELDTNALMATNRLLIVASTTGEGDAPDAASGFVRQVMSETPDLTGVRYGLLALGDRTYTDFCGFGAALEGWLKHAGAQPLFDRVEVDDGDTGALRHWQHQLAILTGSAIQPDWTPPVLDRWRLVERTHLNPGSPGGEAHLLALEPIDHAPIWSAGDIAEVGLPSIAGAPSRGSREYSVASLPDDARAEFIVRRMIGPDGLPGLASGWLTSDLALGDVVAMRIRPNRGFHGPAVETPLILIGNGTGLAGLRAHWKARAGQPHGGIWLMFGERTRAYDAFLDEELQAALASGLMTRLDRVFSRDPGPNGEGGRYVQALIADNAAELRTWVERDAVILVCGSLEGMSNGVQVALEAALGAERVQTMVEAGLYRRDVY